MQEFNLNYFQSMFFFFTNSEGKDLNTTILFAYFFNTKFSQIITSYHLCFFLLIEYLPLCDSCWIICYIPLLHRDTHRNSDTPALQLISLSGLTSFPSSVFHVILLLPWLKGIKPCPQPYSLQWNTHTHIHPCQCGLCYTHYNEGHTDKQISNQTPDFNPVVLNEPQGYGDTHTNTQSLRHSEGHLCLHPASA